MCDQTHYKNQELLKEVLFIPRLKKEDKKNSCNYNNRNTQDEREKNK